MALAEWPDYSTAEIQRPVVGTVWKLPRSCALLTARRMVKVGDGLGRSGKTGGGRIRRIDGRRSDGWLGPEKGFQLAVVGVVNADAGVPFWGSATFGCQAAAAVADGVTFELDGVAATIADLVFSSCLNGWWPSVMSNKNQRSKRMYCILASPRCLR